MDENLSFESILKRDNNWLLFKELYKDELSEDIIHEVEKMLKCCTKECGFATYICTHCGTTKVIPFSCKSKLCSSCGKKHTDIWSQTISEKLLNCDHRHIVFTISDKLWPFFIHNPSLQKLLLDTAAHILKKAFSHSCKQNLTLGFLLILHPFGDDLKPHFHVHAIVTAGGLSENNQWINVNYINYTFIRKTWQYEILSALRKHLPHMKATLDPIIDWCFSNQTNGFVIFADRIIKGSKRATLRYVARYTRHPAISKRRILSYDGTYVTFSYESDGKEYTKRMSKFEFIKAVLQHVASKQFKTVRRFGLYSRRSSSKYELANSLLPSPMSKNIPEFNWRRNITLLTHKDPLICNKCGAEMDLYSITYSDKFGALITIGKDEWYYENSLQSSSKNIHNETTPPRQIYLFEMSC